MAEFRNRVLSILDRIYSFTAAKTYTDKLDLNSPMQLVHDVSREAELGSSWGRFGGYAIANGATTHAGAGTEYWVLDAYYPFWNGGVLDPIVNPGENEMDVWVLGIQLQTTAAPNEVTVGWMTQSIPPAAAGGLNTFVWFRATSTTTYATNWGGTGNVLILCNEGTDQEPAHNPFPFRMPHGSRFWMRTNTGAAATITLSILAWVGRPGTAPPGMR